ncbi:hypothetical protein ABZ953_16695 [Streptomyces sp. NPDC046465]|uniref:hypothetical protein n=1 Tax=Streptomyces sp. NPDC046465 TaxID=3155810 RepID=UPI0033D052E0
MDAEGTRAGRQAERLGVLSPDVLLAVSQRTGREREARVRGARGGTTAMMKTPAG